MMKNHYSTYLGLLFLLMPISICQADTQVWAVQDTNLQACLQLLAKNNDWHQPQDMTVIKCHDQDIHSLRGLEQFTGLESLSLYNNRIEQFDIEIKQLKRLKELNLARNNLTQITVSNLPKLNKLYLFDNQLTDLTLSNLAELETFKANNNKIENFTYINTPKLEKIYIFNNQLETIDIYNLPRLHYMDCRQNPMPDSLYDEMDKKDDVTFLHDGNAEDW
jgi:protein phosphatase 1 regulatory subunit 7